MPQDTLKEYARLRTALEREREQIKARMGEIDAVLAGGKSDGIRVPALPMPRSNTTKARKSGKRPENKLSISEAVTKVTANKPLTVPEIVAAVRKVGYKFASKDPVNSVGAFLYSGRARKLFKRVNGKFSPVR